MQNCERRRGQRPVSRIGCLSDEGSLTGDRRLAKMEAAAAKLMDFSQPMDVALLDQVVTTAFDASHPQVSIGNA